MTAKEEEMQIEPMTLDDVRDVTGRAWHAFDSDEAYDGPGAYVQVAGSAQHVIYAGQAGRVLKRLRDEVRGARNGDRVGVNSHARLMARHRATAWWTEAASVEEARDLESLILAASVHLTGATPIGQGLAWAPRSPRSVTAWNKALAWLEGRAA